MSDTDLEPSEDNTYYEEKLFVTTIERGTRIKMLPTKKQFLESCF